MKKHNLYLIIAAAITIIIFVTVAAQPKYLVENYFYGIEFGFLLLWLYCIVLPILAMLFSAMSEKR